MVASETESKQNKIGALIANSSTRVQKLCEVKMPSVDLSSFGAFKNIILKEEDDCIILKTNVKTPEDVEEWKFLYSQKNNVTLNIVRSYDVVRFALHRRYMCNCGEKRHNGMKKTFTG